MVFIQLLLGVALLLFAIRKNARKSGAHLIIFVDNFCLRRQILNNFVFIDLSVGHQLLKILDFQALRDYFGNLLTAENRALGH